MDIEIVKAFDFNLPFQLLKYNNINKSVEPVDLTGTTVSLNVYDPGPIEVDIKFMSEKTGKIIEDTIVLTQDDSKTYRTLQTEMERQEFFQNLFYVKEYCQGLLQKELVDLENK